MSTIISFTLASFATITAIMAIIAGQKRGISKKLSYLFIWMSVGSSVWSACFGAILLQSSAETAYILRCVGMVGTFACLIFASFLIVEWAKLKNRFARNFVKLFSLLGIIIYPFNIRREYIEFKPASIGMSYSFKAGFWTDMYMLYSVGIALSLFLVVIWMIRSTKKRRIKVMGTRLMISLIVIAVGMLFDTILPAFGILAVPTSSLAQAIGVFIMYACLNFNTNNNIAIANIAKYIDNSTEVYILAYDEHYNLNLASNSAVKFLNLRNDERYKIYDLFDLDEDCFAISKERTRYDAVCVRNGVQCNLGIEVVRDGFNDIIGYVVSVMDMTEKMAYIKEIEEAKQNADKANVAKSTFLASMSHEIRTPLNAIIGMDEIIMREKDISAIYRYAQNIKDAGKSLLAIIDDILDFSKIESGMMNIIEADYDFAGELRQLYSIVKFRASKKGLKLIFDVDNDLPSVLHGDEIRVRQVLMNIINNAVKYTEVGWVKVKVDGRWIDDNNIMLHITVEDTGIGIKKEDMPKLFEKFKRLDENVNHRVEGTGLGLSIVYNLLNMMGGNIQVKSVYQRGSIFEISIPQKVVDKTPMGSFKENYKEEIVEYKESFRAPDAKILVVDDNQINLAIVKGLLKHTEVQIDVAGGGYECLEMVRNKRYDIILLDHMMPEIDGIEVLKRLKEMDDNESKAAVVIALTANALVGAREKYLSYGFDDYICKPIDAILLEDLIQEYLSAELIE